MLCLSTVIGTITDYRVGARTASQTAFWKGCIMAVYRRFALDNRIKPRPCGRGENGTAFPRG